MAEGKELRIGKLHIGYWTSLRHLGVSKVAHDEGHIVALWKFYIWIEK